MATVSMSGRVDVIELESLIDLAQANPVRALEAGSGMLAGSARDDLRSLSIVSRAMGIASRLAADMGEAVRWGRRSVEAAVELGDVALLTEAKVSLAGSLAISGDNRGALLLLDEAVEVTDPKLRADVEFQRGAVLSRMGEVARALASYSTALPVFEANGDEESVAMTLHNRAELSLSVGDTVGAEADLRRAMAIDDAKPMSVRRAGEIHALAAIASLRGDIPTALRHLDESRSQLTALLGSASESQVSRCDVLLSAGLYREALELARATATDMRRDGLAEDEAEARMAGAQAALLAGDFDEAERWAEAATEMFVEQGRDLWEANARLITAQARFESGRGEPGDLAEVRNVARTLGEHGHSPAEARARLLAGLIGASSETGDRGIPDLAWVSHRDHGPIELRVQSRLARATMRKVRGDNRGADAAARSGMRLLEEHQAALGATDVRIGVERHGQALGALGISLALEAGDPRRLFRWIEMRRGTALSHRPVVPPLDDVLSARLTELRYIGTELRTAQGSEVATLVQREQRLQAEIRDRARSVAGAGRRARHPSPSDLLATLGDATLVQYGSHRDRLWSVVVKSGRFRKVDLGDAGAVRREVERLRFGHRRLARGRGSIEAVAGSARRLDEMLLAPLSLPEAPLVILPTPGLHAMPWQALPGCADLPMSVSPSAALWLRAMEAEAVAGGGVVLAAGPDLELADREVSELGLARPGAVVLPSSRSKVEAVLSHVDGARLAHIACHAFFQFENPMFSSLRLADGDLNVYDLERLRTAPEVVVLSACDSGFTETHPGEELMGLSSALLSMGTRSVIASVGLVPDSAATKDLMVSLHRGLVAGLSPSRALHEAQQLAGDTPEGRIAAASFICIGAG